MTLKQDNCTLPPSSSIWLSDNQILEAIDIWKYSIPELKRTEADMFAWADKAWKKLPISEEISDKPKKLSVIPNIPLAWRAMGWPAYYKNPRIAADKSWLGDLAYVSEGRLQLSPLVKARPEVVEMLDRAQKILDEWKNTKNLQLVVVDWYRSLSVQRQLFETYKNYLRWKSPGLSDEELNIEAQKMVSIPVIDKWILAKCPPPHSTWWAVDVILVDKSKIDITKDDWLESAMIDFWAGFDEMMHSEFWDIRSETRFSEWMSEEAKKNRELLYYLLTSIWFSNYHSEWWHYDFGNQFDLARHYDWKESAKFGFAWWIDDENKLTEDLTGELQALEAYQRMFWGKVSKVIRDDFWITV